MKNKYNFILYLGCGVPKGSNMGHGSPSRVFNDKATPSANVSIQ